MDKDVAYIYDVALSGMRRKEILPFATTWVNPEGIMTDISWTEKDKYYMMQSPIFLAPGIGFVEDNFAMDWGWSGGGGWFQDDSSALCSLCILFLFPGGSAGKESACNAGDPSSIPGSGSSTGEGTGYSLQSPWASPGSSADKESTCNVGDLGLDLWVGKIPWRRERLPTLVFWPGEFHGLYSPWGCKELDLTE